MIFSPIFFSNFQRIFLIFQIFLKKYVENPQKVHLKSCIIFSSKKIFLRKFKRSYRVSRSKALDALFHIFFSEFENNYGTFLKSLGQCTFIFYMYDNLENTCLVILVSYMNSSLSISILGECVQSLQSVYRVCRFVTVAC